eukprot:1933157-Amphidinium_carterae.1
MNAVQISSLRRLACASGIAALKPMSTYGTHHAARSVASFSDGLEPLSQGERCVPLSNQTVRQTNKETR